MTALLLLSCAFLVYNANFQRIASGDTLGSSLVPFSLLLDGSVAADRFYPYVVENLPQHARAFHLAHGHAYSGYSVATPLLVTPLYIPAALAAGAQQWDPGRIFALSVVMEKLAASLVAALSVMLFYCLALKLTTPFWSLWAAIAYALGTSTWSISSQALWQHGPSELAVIGGLCCLAHWDSALDDSNSLLMAGLCCAIAIAVRPSNTLFLAAACVAVVAHPRGRARCAYLLAAPAIAVPMIAAYNWRVFGRLTGGYGFEYSGRFWQGLTGILASPSRGLFLYTPLAVFSVFGAVKWIRSGHDRTSPVQVTTLLYAVSSVVLVSFWPIWWGGHCYGPRLLTDIAPCILILALPVMEQASRSALIRLLFGAVLTASVVIQAVGAFCYPQSLWDERPVSIAEDMSRLWDWKDSPIVRSIGAGPRIGPDSARMEEFWRAISGASTRTVQP
jgi:hypothetical protein